MRLWMSVLALGVAVLGTSLRAECRGQDLIAALPASDVAAIRAAADAVPFAVGNGWRAVRGEEEVILIGTLHLDDARFEPVMTALTPYLARSKLVLVEAGPKEQALLKARLAKDPSLVVNTDGPTLPELLPEADWQALAAALSARGVPGFMAAKFRPWYIAVLLSIPPCAMTTGLPNGLDQRLIARAADLGLPVEALEPYDTAFKLFQDGSLSEQVTLLTGAIAAEAQSEDMNATMIASYFAEDVRLGWEFTKLWTRSLPGYDPAAAEAEFALMEGTMMTARNLAWIPVIEAAVAKTDGPVLVAFGALHLAGDQGVLALLQEVGFTLERIAFQ